MSRHWGELTCHPPQNCRSDAPGVICLPATPAHLEAFWGRSSGQRHQRTAEQVIWRAELEAAQRQVGCKPEHRTAHQLLCTRGIPRCGISLDHRILIGLKGACQADHQAVPLRNVPLGPMLDIRGRRLFYRYGLELPRSSLIKALI